jgi:hypothetical protein
MRYRSWLTALIGAALFLPAAAHAQGQGTTAASAGPSPAAVAPRVQTAMESLVQDAREYARNMDVPLDEAMRRLRAQEESVPATDRIQAQYRDRLAGIAIEHAPSYRIVVLLTGSDPVPDQSIVAGGMTVPIVFRTGAPATRDQILAAMAAHRAEIRLAMPGSALGFDPRTGSLAVMLSPSDADRFGRDKITARLAAMTGVPVTVRIADEGWQNFMVEGGLRVEGIDKYSGRRNACTTGFVVTDNQRTAIATAAHCPDTLRYASPGGGETVLDMVGEWGARYQDVQINVSPEPLQPLFFVDGAGSEARTLTTWRTRASTRAGDAVCHRGEKTGYSCSLVQLVDFIPPRDQCGGPCDATWVTVAGPACKKGDSGGPVFSGTIAFGILKGGDYGSDGVCSFYYYMSTDYLPPGWTLLHAGAPPRADQSGL